MLKFFKKIFSCEVLGGLYISILTMGAALIGLGIGICYRLREMIVSDKLLLSLLIIFAIIFLAEIIVTIIFANKFNKKKE